MAIKNKNAYFKHVFEQLQKKGIIVRKHKHRLDDGEYNKRSFAEKLETHSGVIPAILSGERGVTEKIIRNLCKFFNVNESYIRMGEGSIFVEDIVEPISTYIRRNILYSAIHASAGDHISDYAPTAREDVQFGIPGLQGNLFAFHVKGNSMEPILHEGDMVFCRRIESTKEIRDGQIYAIYADGQVRIKYLDVGDRNTPELILLSENHVEHPPIYVDTSNQNVQIYHVVHYLTDMGSRLGFV